MKPKPFDIHFMDNMAPKLRNLIQAKAVCVANGVEDWEDAITAVWEYAAQHGSHNLSPDIQDALDQFIMNHLHTEVTVAEAGIHKRRSPVWNWILRGGSAHITQ